MRNRRNVTDDMPFATWQNDSKTRRTVRRYRQTPTPMRNDRHVITYSSSMSLYRDKRNAPAFFRQ